jgi:hypothetical protein
LTRQISILLRERNAVVARRSSRAHVEAHDTLQQALEYRAARLLHTLAMRLRAMTAATRDAFGSWNRCRACDQSKRERE